MAKKMGRPSRYKKEYCQKLIEHMSQGLSFETFAAVVDVDRDTIYEWVKVYKDFSDAKKKAMPKRNLFVEKIYNASARGQIIRDADGTPLKPNPAMMIFLAKNTLGWSDKVEQVGEVQVAQRLIINPPKTNE
jgi:hypothetical protein